MARKIITRSEASYLLEHVIFIAGKELSEKDKQKIKEICICLQFDHLGMHVWGCDSDEFTKLYVSLINCTFCDETWRLRENISFLLQKENVKLKMKKMKK